MAVHLIETSEEDSYLAVARHISDLLNEGEVSRRPSVFRYFYRSCALCLQFVFCGTMVYSVQFCSIHGRLYLTQVPPLQARTALADTPGSRFTQESEAALAEGRFGDLLNLLVPHFDVLFQKTSGTGKSCMVITHIMPCALPCLPYVFCCWCRSGMLCQRNQPPCT